MRRAKIFLGWALQGAHLAKLRREAFRRSSAFPRRANDFAVTSTLRLVIALGWMDPSKISDIKAVPIK
jgi:hypothetical protein